MPLSILDAFAAGVPVVTTDAGGIPYMVRDGVNGCLVSRGAYAAMAQSSLRLLHDDGLATRVADTARQECLDRYSWPVVAKQWEELYRSPPAMRPSQSNARATGVAAPR